MSQLKLTSPGFKANEPIPSGFTGEGKDQSPPLKWEGAPAGTKSFALICDDPDAPGGTWVHWLLSNIPARISELPEGVAKTESVPALGGAKQGQNSWPKIGYNGPMPPRGHGVHHYHFKLYALDAELKLPARFSKQQLEEVMKNHILAQTALIGTYERK